MKKILITPLITIYEKYTEIQASLDLEWGTFASACNLLLIPVQYTIPAMEYIREIEPDGIILSGGNDLYELDPTPINQLRENYELELIRHASAWNIATLGVCKGGQLLAHHFGSAIGKIEGHVVPKHKVHATPIAEHDWKNIHEVNSYHQFGIKKLSSPLLSLLEAEDGSCEAFRHEELNTAGILWHPERYPEPRAEDISIFKKIFYS